MANNPQLRLPGKKKYVTTQVAKGKRQDVLNSSHSSSFFHGEGLLLSNEERPNPIFEIKLLARENMASKLADILNPVLDVMTKGKSKGKYGIVKDVTLVEENAPIDNVPHEADISRHWAMGKDEVQGVLDSSGNNAGGGVQDQLVKGLAEHPLECLADQPLVKPAEQPAELRAKQLTDQAAEQQVKEPIEQPTDQLTEQRIKQTAYQLVD